MLLLGSGAAFFVPEAAALTDEERAARAAEREARAAERDAVRAAREAEREAERAARDAEEEESEANCGCSATVKFAKPDLQWRNNTLFFIPRVDIAVRTDGEPGGPAWAVGLAYDGTTSFSSDDVTPPAGSSFSGSRSVAQGACGDNRYNFKGLALEGITLGDITRSLVGAKQELDGQVQMSAHIEGCGFDEESKSLSFTVKEFGNLSVRGWRAVR